MNIKFESAQPDRINRENIEVDGVVIGTISQLVGSGLDGQYQTLIRLPGVLNCLCEIAPTKEAAIVKSLDYGEVQALRTLEEIKILREKLAIYPEQEERIGHE